MIDIRITRNQDHIEFIPTAKLCFFGGGGEPVGQGTCAWGGHVFFSFAKAAQGRVAVKRTGLVCGHGWCAEGLVLWFLVLWGACAVLHRPFLRAGVCDRACFL